MGLEILKDSASQQPILCIETSSQLCSVAICIDGEIITTEVFEEQNAHAQILFTLVDSCLQKAGLKKSDLVAIAVSEGPGSYTGLRIGVAAAKGFCQALNIPLIGVSSLATLAQAAKTDCDFIVPMLDARRNEVYTAVFDKQLQIVEAPHPHILEESSFASFLEQGKVYFIGNGSTKWQKSCVHPHAFYNDQLMPLAQNMCKMAQEKWVAKNFENLAYFVPDYLKPVHIL
jgi:tRNA threonylcarbamoyladenosine biosynthesis protein TsaB